MGNPRNITRGRQVPKQERSRAAVAAIQEATLLVLLEDGFSGLTTNAIAERAGVGIGSIYRYFTNKESIVASLTRNAGSEMLSNPQARELFCELDLECRLRFGFIGALADQAELMGVAVELSAKFERRVRIDSGTVDTRDLRFWKFVIDPQQPSALPHEAAGSLQAADAHQAASPREAAGASKAASAREGAGDALAAEMLWAVEVGFLSTLLSRDSARAEDPLILDRVVAIALACVQGEPCSAM